MTPRRFALRRMDWEPDWPLTKDQLARWRNPLPRRGHVEERYMAIEKAARAAEQKRRERVLAGLAAARGEGGE